MLRAEGIEGGEDHQVERPVGDLSVAGAHAYLLLAANMSMPHFMWTDNRKKQESRRSGDSYEAVQNSGPDGE